MPRETMQPDVWAVILVPLIPAGMVLCLRFYARSIKSVPLWWDDWLAILSFVRFAKALAILEPLRCYGGPKRKTRRKKLLRRSNILLTRRRLTSFRFLQLCTTVSRYGVCTTTTTSPLSRRMRFLETGSIPRKDLAS